MRKRDQEDRPELLRIFLFSLRALLEGKQQESLEATERYITLCQDPERSRIPARDPWLDSNRLIRCMRCFTRGWG